VSSSTPPATVTLAKITTSTNGATMTLLGILLWIGIVATPIVVVISVCLMVYFKKRRH